MPNDFLTSRDPVCGVDVTVAESTHSTSWHGIVHHFCGRRCQERFLASPAFYTAPIRTQDIVPIPRKCKLRFVAPEALALSDACVRLLAMKGILAALPGKDCIAITYDLRRLLLAQIEAELEGAGLILRQGLHRWRRALWKFEESNEIENVQAGNGACCSRPPPRLR